MADSNKRPHVKIEYERNDSGAAGFRVTPPGISGAVAPLGGQSQPYAGGLLNGGVVTGSDRATGPPVGMISCPTGTLPSSPMMFTTSGALGSQTGPVCMVPGSSGGHFAVSPWFQNSGAVFGLSGHPAPALRGHAHMLPQVSYPFTQSHSSLPRPQLSSAVPQLADLISPLPGKYAPSLGNCVPSFGKDSPSLGNCVPSFGKDSPSLGNCAPSLGNCAPSLGNYTPSSSVSVPLSAAHNLSSCATFGATFGDVSASSSSGELPVPKRVKQEGLSLACQDTSSSYSTFISDFEQHRQASILDDRIAEERERNARAVQVKQEVMFGNFGGESSSKVEKTETFSSDDFMAVDDVRRAVLGVGRGTVRVKDEGEGGGVSGGGGEGEAWEPPLWREQLENIRKMRASRDAPVDTDGCHMNADFSVPPMVRRYQILISLMMSSQTKDQITAGAMKRLKRHGLTIENILETPEEDVARLIHPVGFWKKKADYIKRVTQILADKFNGDIPSTMEELMSLPGIGPKMSHLIMDVAWNVITGVAVDTHVHRISHRLGWMRKESKDPKKTQAAIEQWLPRSEWGELNWLIVGFGQQRCLPQRPRCTDCLNKEICPSVQLGKSPSASPAARKSKASVKRKPSTSPASGPPNAPVGVSPKSGKPRERKKVAPATQAPTTAGLHYPPTMVDSKVGIVLSEGSTSLNGQGVMTDEGGVAVGVMGGVNETTNDIA